MNSWINNWLIPNMSEVLATEITSYGNILINSPERLETFKETLENWQEKIGLNMKIRFRGTYANDAAKYCKKFSNMHIEVGSDFIQWRNQASHDIRAIESKYIMIFLEDHQIFANLKEFIAILEFVKNENVDVLQYSWFKHYENTRSYIKQTSKNSNSPIHSLKIDRKVYEEFIRPSGTYIISLTSIFNREYLLSILKTRRPFLRKYDSRGPFDVEKSPNQHFYLPMKYALPVAELALCVDDEMGITGSSAISRGLSNLPLTNRGINHYSKISPKYWVSKIRSTALGDSFDSDASFLVICKKPISFLLNTTNVISNTLMFLIFEVIDLKRDGAKN